MPPPDARALAEGELVFLHRGWLAFFDRAHLLAGELEVQRLAGAAAFVEAVVNDS